MFADRLLTAILEPHGAFSLPDTFVVAHRLVDTLTERYRAARKATADGLRVARAKNHRSAELVDLATAGSLPESVAEIVAPVVTEQAEYDATILAVTLLSGARETAEARLRSVIVKSADAFVVDHLRPAHAETMTAALRASVNLAGVDISDLDTVLSAAPPVQAAYRDAKALAGRYERLRAAREALAKVAGHGISEFVELSGHPASRLPANPVARTLAIAESGLAWMPSFVEEGAAKREDRDRIAAENRSARKRGIVVLA